MSLSINNTISSSRSSSAAPAPNSSRYLDWTQRPEELKSSISTVFKEIVTDSKSSWGSYNGDYTYKMCGVKERKMIKKMILEAYPAQKEFYVLDVGAGNFQWINGLASYLNRKTDLPKDIKVHIIGIRGEKHTGEKIVEAGRCKIYFLGAFKIEELKEQFEEQGLDLNNKIDLAISRWCFRHLVDPVGTFAQTYNLLRPKAGFLLMDGFTFFHENQKLHEDRRDDEDAFNYNMAQLFLDTQAPFLTKYFYENYSLNHFILRKPDNAPCRLPMSYIGSKYMEWNWQIGSHITTRFKREPQPYDSEELNMPCDYYSRYGDKMHGDKKMYEWLKENRLLEVPSLSWYSLQNKEAVEQWAYRGISNKIAIVTALAVIAFTYLASPYFTQE